MRNSILPLLLSATACAGVDYKFDPSPAPPWTEQPPANAAAAKIESVGRSPVTPHVQRDLDLATRDAGKQVALLFESKVKSASTDWTLSLSGGEGTKEISVVGSDIVVKTDVKVEGSSVKGSYRDEGTKTQYVLMAVDRGAWSALVGKRVDDHFAKIERELTGANTQTAEGRALAALAQLSNGYVLAAQAQPDVIVLSLLQTNSDVRSKHSDAKQRLDTASVALRKDYCFTLAVDGDARAAAELKRNLEQFVGGYGFSLSAGCAKAIELRATVGQRFVREEKVANRVERIHEASGKLEVFQPGKQAFTKLNVSLPPNAHTERATDEAQATTKALDLAAASLARKFRSAFRKQFGMAGE